MKSFTKKKIGTSLGFKTPGFVRGKSNFSKGNIARFNPATFKTQHKG